MTYRTLLRPALLLGALLAGGTGASAQTALVQGNLSGFDVLNNTGQPAYGFELQLEGALPNDLYYTYPYSRYGAPAVVAYATGVYVRYQAVYVNNQWTTSTPVANYLAFSWQDCYMAGAGYAKSGCEHLAQSLHPIPTSRTITVTGRWLIEDPANPGQLLAANPPAPVPQVTWAVVPPTSTLPAPPVISATVPPPPAPPAPPAQFADAFWMKIFKTELPRSVDGSELSSDNPSVVPEDATQIETNWVLLQKAPPGSQNQRGKANKVSTAPLSITAGSIVRRYEVYKYSGTYDPSTHEALCADTVCNAPATGELGNPVSANNTAINAVADSLTVTMAGSGANSARVSVGGSTCSSASCANFGTNGVVVALTANPSGTVFTGWTGGCTGTQLTCSVTVNGKTGVGTQFLKLFTLSVGRSNAGIVSATPDGNDKALNCGSACSSKYADGTVVTLTATPAAGKTFVNWAGACSGSGITCTVAVSKDTSVQAVFSK